MKKYLPWILLGAVLVGGVYLYATWRGDLKVVEEKLKNEAAKVTLLTGQIAEVVAQVTKSEKALEKFQADSAIREKWFQSQLKKVTTATPQELVDEGSRIINAHDITTDGKIVTMGVETYRQFITIAVDWQEYKNVRAPGWLVEKGLLNDQIAGFKQERLLDAQKDAALNESIRDLKNFISHQKIAGTLEKVLWVAAGVGAGMLVNKVIR